MSAAHTPGPWAAHHHERTDTYTIHVAGRSWESWAVAHVGDCTQDEANARLIAAAPRMAAALQRAAHLLAELPDQTPQLLALRSEIVATITEATPEYYGRAA